MFLCLTVMSLRTRYGAFACVLSCCFRESTFCAILCLSLRLKPRRKLEKTCKFIDPTQLLPFAGGRSPWIFDPESYFFNDASSL